MAICPFYRHKKAEYDRFYTAMPEKQKMPDRMTLPGMGRGFRLNDHRKIYLRTNSTARMYISGVTFLALPVSTFSTT